MDGRERVIFISANTGRPHFTQQINGTELNGVPIVLRERFPACQQRVNGFAGADKFRASSPIGSIASSPYEEKDRGCVKIGRLPECHWKGKGLFLGLGNRFTANYAVISAVR